MHKHLPTCVSSLLILLSAVFSPWCGPGGVGNNGQPAAEVRKTPKVLIWCDVTGSLLKSESVRVAEIAADILDRLPAQAEYTLYPIHRMTSTPNVIKESKASQRASNSNLSQGTKDARRREILKEIEKQYPAVNGDGQPRERTCILNTLRTSERYFAGIDTEKYEPYLIYISDMIEHCNQTPLGRYVDLNRVSPAEAATLADSFDSPPNLSRLNIYVIIPSTNETPTVAAGARPDLDVRKAFWDAIFRKCNVSDEALQATGWLTKIPDGLLAPPKPHSAGR